VSSSDRSVRAVGHVTAGTRGRPSPAPLPKARTSGPGLGLELIRPVAGVGSRILTKAVRRVEARWLQLYGPGNDTGNIPRLLAAFALAADRHDAHYVDDLLPRPSLRLSQHLLDLMEAELITIWNAGEVASHHVLPAIASLRDVRTSIEQRFQHLPGAPLLGPDGLEFLMEFAHDLRSPLNAVLFLAENLQQGRSGDVNVLQRRQLGLIYGAALALSSVASNALGLAREHDYLEEGEPTPFSITEMLEGIRDIVRPIAEEKGLALNLVPPRVDLRLGHPLELHRTLLNLATNGLKFTHQGSVSIRAEDGDANRVEFSVRDTGGGINPQAQEALFQPFRRSSGEQRYTFSSTGLGLAISRRLVAAMGGRLAFDTSPTAGTHFHFALDLPPA
jgi:signal transduction histidine kinase